MLLNSKTQNFTKLKAQNVIKLKPKLQQNSLAYMVTKLINKNCQAKIQKKTKIVREKKIRHSTCDKTQTLELKKKK